MAQQTLASISTTEISNSGSSYDIFINHRGRDVKNTFASHLYRQLVSHRLRTFLEQEELDEGSDSPSEIGRALKGASVHVAIFSPKYAESAWCLNELLQMLESGAPIIPVFYHVKPADLQWTPGEEGLFSGVLKKIPWLITHQDGVYARALGDLKRKRTYDAQTRRMKPRYQPGTIEKWRQALSRVADISGLELEAYNGDEGVLAEKVVQRVVKRVRNTPLPLDTYGTGLDELLQEFERTVLQKQQPPAEARVVGIVGAGGIGKTTLAKEFFNRKRSDYDRSAFLFDVREASLIDLQRKLIRDLIPLDPKMDNMADATGKLSRYLHSCQTLIVLDDVDNVEQVNALFSPMKAVLRSDSLILLTSRNKNLLSGMNGSTIYELRGLNAKHSQELFCWNAFHQRCPVPGFVEVVGTFLSECMGLPLSLKVFGALLYGKDVKYWKDQLCKISKVLPADDTQSRLKISYDSLDHQDKQMFLDIACFLIGKDKDTAIRIWNGSGWEGSLGLVNLENKCLVEIDNKKRLRMHHHLRDLGRYLADKEPPGCPRRLWLPPPDLPHNVFTRLPVRGISISEQISGQSVGFSNRSIDMSGLQLLSVEGDSGLQLLSVEGDCLESIYNMVKKSDLAWLRWDRCPYPSLPPWIPLRNLRVLEVAGGQLETLWKDTNEAPLHLRELHIGTLLRFPRSIGQLKHLEKIELEDIISELPEEFFDLRSLKHWKLRTRMKCLPDSLRNLTNLRHIDLSHSKDLQLLPPSFGNLTKLQHVNLNGCSSLERLPNSFGNLSRLKHLYLAGCSGLTFSGETLGHISTLESIDFSLCHKMEALPSQVTHQRFLEKLKLSMTMLKELPSDIGNLINLEVLKLDCPLLETLPPSLGNLTSLKELSLIGCPELKRLPESVAMLKELTMLTVDNAGIEYLPVGIVELSNLESLSVKTCPLLEVPFFSVEDIEGRKEALESLRNDKSMLRLKDLDLQGTRIKRLSFPQRLCPNLHHLNISGALELVEVGALPTTLISLNLNGCTALEKITGLCGLVKLRRLDIQECYQVEELPDLQILISLDDLQADRYRLKSIQGLAPCTNLRMPSSDDPSEFNSMEKNDPR